MSTPAQLNPGGGRPAPLILQRNAVKTKVLNGGNFTIPEVRAGDTSPSVRGGSPNSLGNVDVGGAWIYAITSNDSTVNEMTLFDPIQIFPGDLVAVAVAANVLTVTVNSETIFEVTGAALTSAAVLIMHY